ncbi:MAG: phosphatase PAP2 family protein [Terracidiphilus sp.]
MRVLDVLLHPAFMAITALFLSIIWMLRDEKDKTRVGLVFALLINLFYGVLCTLFMRGEGSAFPWKYDHVLARLDRSLGVDATVIAQALARIPHNPLWIVYDAMVPMMIAWYLVARYRRFQGSIIMAYVAELVAGPLLYAIVPACGPVYAFGKQWLHPPDVVPAAVRLTGMPNAFPSLHLATAFVFVMFAPGKIWKAIALLFLVATGLATLSTGEHYVIDLIPGLVFGVFASSVGTRNYRRAACFFVLALVWSLAVRFGYWTLLAHPILLRSFAVLTLVSVTVALVRQWTTALALAETPETVTV